jgi:hypothetical protein
MGQQCTILPHCHSLEKERVVDWKYTCPVSSALIRKYVDTSIGEMTPFGTYTKDPSEKTAEFKAAK